MPDYHNEVGKLCSRYKTCDPFALCRELHIKVLFMPLQGVRGFFQNIIRNRFIYIDESLAPEEQRIVCAHELGHAILHRNSNAIFMEQHTYMCVNRFENEANAFAAYLLISDENLMEAREYGYTISQTAAMCGVPEELVKMRIRK